jgi:CarD family transcriptional regulator
LQLTVGQNVVHPTHGIGEIINIKQMDIVEGFKRYYVIEFLTKKLTSHVPIRKVDDLGLRKIMSEARVEEVYNTLSDTPNDLPGNYKKRRKIIEDLLQSGAPKEIAQAVRELTWRKESEGLSNKEKQLLSQARDKLIAEIAMVTDMTSQQARKYIDQALVEAIARKETIPA